MYNDSPKPVDEGLRGLSREEPPAFHYERTMAGVRQRKQRSGRMSRAVLRTSIAGVALAAVVAGLLFIPVTYTVHMGSMVTVEFPISEMKPSANLQTAFDGIDGLINRNFSIMPGKVKVDLAFEKLSAEEAETLIRDRIAALPTDTKSVTITSEEVTKQVGGNALAALTGGTLTIAVDGVAPEDMRQVMMERLRAAGADVQDVQVTHLENGEMKIQIQLGDGEGTPDPNAASGDPSFEWQEKDK